VVHEKHGVEKEAEKPCGDVIIESTVKFLTFSTGVEHEQNGSEVEKKKRRTEFEKPMKRRRKCLRVS
ncbi:hypothetical protein HAX54_027763, partial [Datura stramonium]|nr:hypothetical protein [Datura stramonium]